MTICDFFGVLKEPVNGLKASRLAYLAESQPVSSLSSSYDQKGGGTLRHPAPPLKTTAGKLTGSPPACPRDPPPEELRWPPATDVLAEGPVTSLN